MANDTRDPKGEWRIQVCPGCGEKVCVPAVAEAQAGRCPRCNTSLEPAPAAIRVVKSGRHRPSPPPPPVEEPPDGPEVDLRRVQRRPRRESGIASLSQNTFTFPWQPSNLRAWILHGVGWSLTALMAAAVWHLTRLHQTEAMGQGIYFRVIILWWKGVILFFLWTGFYAGSYFLATVQDTAAGQDKTSWPDDSLADKFLHLMYLLWVICCAALPAAPLVMVVRYGFLRVAPLEMALRHAFLPPDSEAPLDGLILALVPAILVVPWVLWLTFPWFFLASQATQSAIGFWHDRLFLGLLRRPGLMAVFYLASGLLLVPCYVLGVATVFFLQYYLVPLTGFVCSAALLIYGRLLGRVGGIVSGQEFTSTRRRR
jgi:hypothetical protein